MRWAAKTGELHLERLIPALSAGLVIGLLEVVLATSFAALIFSGPLVDRLPAGIGLDLFAGAVIMLLIALLGTQPGVVGSIQDSPAVILALVAASIAARVPPGEARFLTVVAAIGTTSLAAGALFFLLATFRLGDFVRFVPYPVVGGFLAGTGWLLVKGGTSVLTGSSVTLADLSALSRSGAVAKWGPGLAFAVILLVAVRRYHHFLIIPGALFGAVALFYAVTALSGVGVGRAQANGWLLGPFPRAGLWRPWMVSALGRADWHAVFAQAGSAVTLIVVALLSLLLNASGIELALDRDVDLDRELRAAGLANLAAGAGGGMVGFQALSLTALASRTGALSRLAGVLGSSVCVAALLFGSSALAKFPRPVLGGLIVFLGLGFLVEWVWDARRRLHRTEYFVVLLILVVIGAVGFLTGVAVGIAVTLLLFVVNYSRTDMVRHTLTGTTYRSTVERTESQREVLRGGTGIHVMELQGFIFFGTAKTMLDRIAFRLFHSTLGPLRFLVLDFRRVTGLDSSAVMTFVKVAKLAEVHGFVLVLTGLSVEMRGRVERGGLAIGGAGSVRTFSDLDHGMEWCEDEVLAGTGELPVAELSPLTSQLQAILGEAIDVHMLMPYLTRIEIEAGHTIIRQGDNAEEVYFLESGRLTAQLETGGESPPLRIRTMSPGTVLGELPLYLGTARTVSVVADTACALYRLSNLDFKRMESEAPELAAALHRMFARFLAQRLADSLQTMSALLD